MVAVMLTIISISRDDMSGRWSPILVAGLFSLCNRRISGSPKYLHLHI
jgi:hypothetical protein